MFSEITGDEGTEPEIVPWVKQLKRFDNPN